MRTFGCLVLLFCGLAITAEKTESGLESSQEAQISEDDSKTLENNSCQGICNDEPPPVLNGKPLEFERTCGSTVQYECNRSFYKTGHSTVRCESGGWKGQPPTCVYFDSTFVLESIPFASPDFTCYSDKNFGKIEYQRVPDKTGGKNSLDDFSKETFLNRPRFNNTRYEYSEKIGVFQCELNGVHGYMKIVTLTQSLKSAADFSPVNQFKTVSVGDSVEFDVQLNIDYDLPVRWKHDGVDLPAWFGELHVEIKNVQVADAGIYECFFTGRRNKNNHAFIRLIVRKCKANRYGENCDQKCPPCYNGGVCHDHLGVCVCPAGFRGTNCEIPCDGKHFGSDCSKKCASAMCSFRRFCMPDPLGCHCSAGYSGYGCFTACAPGWYGADCKQNCHCARGPTSCNKYTGACEGGCADGWTGRSCQIKVPVSD